MVRLFKNMHFFFRLPERKRCQKERTPAVPVGLLRPVFRLNGRKLASLRQPAVSYACPPPYASRPPVKCRRAMRHQAVLCRDVACRVSAQRRRAAPKRRGVKRSEFLPFRLKAARSSPGDSALDFFLLVSFLFAARQKEKYTDKPSVAGAVSPPRWRW